MNRSRETTWKFKHGQTVFVNNAAHKGRQGEVIGMFLGAAGEMIAVRLVAVMGDDTTPTVEVMASVLNIHGPDSKYLI